MAVGAHIVPGLIPPRPMQPVARLELLIGIEVEPALAALILASAVPCDAERLVPAAGHGDQILLQRVYAEGVRNLIVVQSPVRTVGAHHELFARARECGRDAEMLE